MSRSALTARDRRTLILGAVCIGTLLLVSRGLPAWRGWVVESRAAAAEQCDEAARAEALARVFPAMRDSLAARNGRFLALAPRLLSGGSLNAASATLASLVSGAAADAGVTLGAVQLRTRGSPLPADTGRRGSVAGHAGTPRPAFVRVLVEGDVSGDIRGITRFLLALEQGPVRLVVRDFTITQSDAVGAPDRAEVLHATVAVEGLALAAAVQPADGRTR
jgi:hypothetical protein